MIDIEVPLGWNTMKLISEYGASEIGNASVFSVECTCSDYHSLEPDGETYCDCGALVQSPLLKDGLI